jgi:hypothetical protein
MPRGLWDDIPLRNIDRDKAWEAFIKRKDVKELFEMCHDQEFKFPLGQGFYELWCLCWERAWTKGYESGAKCDLEADYDN